ncbi:MAG: cellulose-binding, family, partial [Mycobacterium sp.]|nr:cellulose-binding, family [Mycobacterium sp.]
NLPNINFVGMHLYPGSWGETDDWGTSWIASHAALGKTAGKPTIVDEFDTSDVTGDPAWFATWTQEADRDGVAGWLVWSLLAVDGNGKPFSWAQGITCPGTPTGACSVLEQSAKSLIGS